MTTTIVELDLSDVNSGDLARVGFMAYMVARFSSRQRSTPPLGRLMRALSRLLFSEVRARGLFGVSTRSAVLKVPPMNEAERADALCFLRSLAWKSARSGTTAHPIVAAIVRHLAQPADE